MCYEQRHRARVHADTDAVAGYTRLSYFKNRVTNAVAIADAENFTIEKSLDGEVFCNWPKVKSLRSRKLCQ